MNTMLPTITIAISDKKTMIRSASTDCSSVILSRFSVSLLCLLSFASRSSLKIRAVRMNVVDLLAVCPKNETQLGSTAAASIIGNSEKQ